MLLTIGGVDVTGNCVSAIVNLKENAISEVTLIANDEQGETFLEDAELGDAIVIKYKYEDFGQQDWDLITPSFVGEIVELQPQLNIGEETCAVKGYGIGIPLKRMIVGAEYGLQSSCVYSTLREILLLALGIIPKFYEKILNNVSSGYTIGTDYVGDVAQQVNFILFNFEPVLNSLNDLLAVLSALLRVTPSYDQAGLHWIVTPVGMTSPYSTELCVATIGDHNIVGAAGHNVQDVWATYATINGVAVDSANPLEVATDMIETQFSAKKPDGNYILCTGTFKYPARTDFITENNSGQWDTKNGFGTIIDSQVAGYVKEGLWSLKFHLYDSVDCFFYPKTGDLNWNINKIGTARNIPEIGFWFRSGAQVLAPKLILYAPDYANHFEVSLDGQAQEAWVYRIFQLGIYAQKEWTPIGSPSWDNIHKIAFEHGAVILSNADVWVDGLHIFGIVTRAAYSSTSITAHGAKIKTIVDCLAVSDNLDPADDTCAVALTAKAELFRSKATSITGTIRVPLMPQAMGGQLVHIHASRTEDLGTYPTGFKINEDFRILQHTLAFTIGGVYSILSLTNDRTNCLLPIPNLYNALLKATETEFQSKNRATLKAKDADYGQSPIEFNYG